MHEFSICRNILDAVLQEADGFDKPPRRITKVFLTVGRVHQIIPDYLTFAWQTLTKGTLADGSAIDITVAQVRVRCRACGWEGGIDMPFFVCGSCKAARVDVLNGMEMSLDRLEADFDDEGNQDL